jgi:ribosomal protein L11 methyltransferase
MALECGAAEKDDVVCELWGLKTIGIQEEDLPGDRCRLRAFFYRDREVESLRQQFARYGAEIRLEESKDWTTAWQPYWTSRLVGERFFLTPSWSNEPTPAGRMRLMMHPGLACGTGAHPATQISIEMLERCVEPGQLVIDVGTGSGILTIAAWMLGARFIAACDLDPIAMDVAGARFRNEGVNAAVLLGSLRSLRDECADLLVMNINATTDVQLLDEVKRVLRAGSAAIVSGYPDSQLERVEQAYQGAGFRCEQRLVREEWGVIVCRKQ